MGTITDINEYRRAKVMDADEYPPFRCPKCGSPSYPQFKCDGGLTVAYLCSGDHTPHPGGNRTRTFRVHYNERKEPGLVFSGWTGKRLIELTERPWLQSSAKPGDES